MSLITAISDGVRDAFLRLVLEEPRQRKFAFDACHSEIGSEWDNCTCSEGLNGATANK